MDLKKEFENLPITDLGRIEQDLDGFRVRAVISVGGVRHVATRITYARRDDTVIAAQQVLHTPEAAACEHRTLKMGGHR